MQYEIWTARCAILRWISRTGCTTWITTYLWSEKGTMKWKSVQKELFDGILFLLHKPWQILEALMNVFAFEHCWEQVFPSKTNPDSQLKHPFEVPSLHVAHWRAQPCFSFDMVVGLIFISSFQIMKRDEEKERKGKREKPVQIPELS